MLTEKQLAECLERRKEIAKERIALKDEERIIDGKIKLHYIDKYEEEFKKKYNLNKGDKVIVTQKNWDDRIKDLEPLFFDGYEFPMHIYGAPDESWLRLRFFKIKKDGTPSQREAAVYVRHIKNIKKVTE